VLGVRDDDADQQPVLVVEDVVQSGQTGTAA
jgi:hypoxanthine-guanine phosphoribosyltransferase